MSDGGNSIPRITKAEHIGPDDTGDNISAKKVALYVDDGNFNGTWIRMTQPGGTGGGSTQYADGATTVTHPIGTIPVYDKSGTITAVSVANPLPVAASLSLSNYANETGGNLASIKTNTDKLDVALSTRLKPADTLTAVTTVGTITNVVHIDDNAGSLTIDATSLPLPTGAATSAKQLPDNHNVVVTSAPTTAVTAAALPLPSGASTSALQTTGNSSLSSIDGKLSGTLTTATTGNVGTTSHVVNVGQTTSNTTRVQLTASSIVSTNGILVQGLSGNIASVFVGDNTVTTSTGFELQAGQAVPFTTANVNNLYVIGANGTDGVCWSVL